MNEVTAARPVDDIARLATTRGFLALALPLTVGAGVNWAMHFTNRLFLSHYSPDALAASLPAGMLCYTVQSFFIASTSYVGAFAGQHVGAGEDEEAGAMAWPMLWVALSSALVAAAVLAFRHRVFALYGATPEVTAAMLRLGSWYLLETVPVVVLAGLSGWFGGLGRTRLVLGLSLGVCLGSVGLNRWLIFGGWGVPPLGIDGAGLASVVATTAGCMVAAAIFFSPATRERFGTWRQRNRDPRRLARFCRAALPRGGTEVLEMAAMLAFTTAIAGLGTAELAANNLVFSLYLLVMVPLIGLGQGITIAVGQAIGATRSDIARAIARRAGAAVACVLVPAGLLFAFAPDLLMSIYVPAHPDDLAGGAERWRRILTLGHPLMLLCVPMFAADGAHIVWRFAVQGAGDTRWPLVALTSAAVLLSAIPSLVIARRIPAATLAAWGTTPLIACWIVFTVYIAAIGGLMCWRYRTGPWAAMTLRA